MPALSGSWASAGHKGFGRRASWLQSPRPQALVVPTTEQDELWAGSSASASLRLLIYKVETTKLNASKLCTHLIREGGAKDNSQVSGLNSCVQVMPTLSWRKLRRKRRAGEGQKPGGKGWEKKSSMDLETRRAILSIWDSSTV